MGFILPFSSLLKFSFTFLKVSFCVNIACTLNPFLLSGHTNRMIKLIVCNDPISDLMHDVKLSRGFIK